MGQPVSGKSGFLITTGKLLARLNSRLFRLFRLFRLELSHPADGWLVIIIAALLFLTNPRQEWWQMLLLTALLLVWLGLHLVNLRLLGRQKSLKTGLYLFGVQLTLIGLLVWFAKSIAPVYLGLLIPLRALRFYSERAGYWLTGLVWLVMAILMFPFSENQQTYSFNLVIWTVVLVFSFSRTGSNLREARHNARTERLLRELEASHRQLQAYSLQAEELAATQERNRIAREIHDSLGHYLIAINVQLEKALVLFPHKPQEACQTVENTRRLVGEALQDVRRSVATLRNTESNFSLSSALESLVTEVGKGNSFRLELKIEGSETGFANQTFVTLHRVAQEALTNVQKYARATEVAIRVEFLAHEARLTVKDNGRGFEPEQLQELAAGRFGGYGLQGARERLELIGGYL
jgi:signal transduction histidine kinase